MSAYAFDLDGTLDRPQIAQLANDLHDAGHEVYVVTGGLSDSGEWTEAARQEKVRRLGVHCTQIVRCIHPDVNQIGRLKGEACDRLGVTVLLDDLMLYLDGAAASRATRLLVLP